MLKYTYFAQFQCVCRQFLLKKIELLETAIIFWVVLRGWYIFLGRGCYSDFMKPLSCYSDFIRKKVRIATLH
jgi:hypothetical protein